MGDRRDVDERDDDLVIALRALGDDLVAALPGDADPVAGARREIAGVVPAAGAGAARSRVRVQLRRRPIPGIRWSPPSRRVAVAALAGVVLAGAVIVAAPGPRRAVADLLGIGGVRFVPRDELPGGDPRGHAANRSDGAGLFDPPGDADEVVGEDLARELGLGESLPVDVALASAPAPMDPRGVGDADAAFTGLPERAVTLAWEADDALPAIEAVAPSEWGLILTVFPGTAGAPAIFKAPGPLTTVTAVTVGGRSGYWVADRPHEVVVLGPDGHPAAPTVRLAGNTLLWTAGGVTYRLESGLDRDAAIALAETIRRPPNG